MEVKNHALEHVLVDFGLQQYREELKRKKEDDVKRLHATALF